MFSTMQAARALIPRQARQSRLLPNTLAQSTLNRSVRILVLARRNYATNSTKPAFESPHSQTHEVPHIAGHNVKSPGLENYMAGADKVPGAVVNPYKDGPSALDKAMTSFLFTELVRGEEIYTYQGICSYVTNV